MARDHARLDLYIWNDDDFRGLSAPAKLVYLNLISLPNLSYAGVLDLSVKRWARAHPDLGIDGVRAAIAELDAERFVVIDHDTEELLVRSFIRRDELWKQPNMLRAALRVAFDVESPILRTALAAELRRLPTEVTGPAPAVAAAELLTGAHKITPVVLAAFTARPKARAATPEPPSAPVDTEADAEPADAANPRSEGSPNPSENPSPMDLGEGSRERGTSLGSLASRSKKVGGFARETDLADPPTEPTTTPHPLDDPNGGRRLSVRAARRAEAERLVTTHSPAQPRVVLDRLRREVIAMLADDVQPTDIAAGLRVWTGKRLAASYLPELVGEQMRAHLAAADTAKTRQDAHTAAMFERVRASAIDRDDDSPIRDVVCGPLPAHPTVDELAELLQEAGNRALEHATTARSASTSGDDGEPG